MGKEKSPRSVRILMTGIYSMEEAVNAINFGLAQRFLFKPWRPDRLLQLLRNTARTFLLERSARICSRTPPSEPWSLEPQVADRTRELEATNRQPQQRNTMLQKMALTDALTGLPNRRAMDRLAKNELLRRARTPAPFALVWLTPISSRTSTRVSAPRRRPRLDLARTDARQLRGESIPSARLAEKSS